MRPRAAFARVLAVICAALALIGCSGSGENAAASGAEAQRHSTAPPGIGLPLIGAAFGFWPSDAASFGAPFTSIGYLGQAPQAFGDGSWLSGQSLATLTPGGQSLATELRKTELLGSERAYALTGSLAAAYRGDTGALAVLGRDGRLSYSGGNGEPAHTQFAAAEDLLPGAYILMLSSRFLAIQGPDGAISVYALPDMKLSWQSQAARGSLALTEESLICLSADGALRIRSLDTGALALELALGLKPGLVAPLYDGKLIIIADAEGGVLALDPQTQSLQWRVTEDYPVEQLISDGALVYAFGYRDAVGIAKDQGRVIARVSLPERALLPPQLFGAIMVYIGVDGLVYANDLGASRAAAGYSAEEERLAPAIRFRLDKYLVDHSIAELAGPFLPYVDMAPHDGILPFTVFEYLAPEQSGEMVLELFEGDGKARPKEGIVSVFDESGEELKANVDEFGSHPSLNHWFDAGKRYYLAVGRRAPGLPPLFLRVRKL